MNKGNTVKRKTKITLKAPEAFYRALEEMAAASGETGPRAVDAFCCELMEVAIIDCYRKRFNKNISGNLIPDDVVEPEPEVEEETEGR